MRKTKSIFDAKVELDAKELVDMLEEFLREKTRKDDTGAPTSLIHNHFRTVKRYLVGGYYSYNPEKDPDND